MIVCVCVTEYACTIIWCNMLCHNSKKKMTLIQIRNSKIKNKNKNYLKKLRYQILKYKYPMHILVIFDYCIFKIYIFDYSNIVSLFWKIWWGRSTHVPSRIIVELRGEEI